VGDRLLREPTQIGGLRCALVEERRAFASHLRQIGARRLLDGCRFDAPGTEADIGE
jgi:hypothetical protein